MVRTNGYVRYLAIFSDIRKLKKRRTNLHKTDQFSSLAFLAWVGGG